MSSNKKNQVVEEVSNNTPPTQVIEEVTASFARADRFGRLQIPPAPKDRQTFE